MIKSNWFSDYNIAVFTLFFMSVQFLFVEGWAISIPKVVFMATTPLFLLIKSPYVSKAAIFGLLFWVVTVSISVIQFGTPHMSTFYYTVLFLATFTMYYNLVHINRVFSLDDFLRIVQIVIFAYAGCLLLQQLFFGIGIHYMPLINLMGQPYYSLFRLNTLAIEPSQAARILTVYFYAFLKLLEYKNDVAPSIALLRKEYRWTVIAFLYTMLAMGSGTAFVGLGILALYFMKKQYAVYIIAFGFAFYMIVPMIDYEPFNRAMAVFNATLTGDTDLVRETDHSASARVNIILDTIKYLDLSRQETWLGQGIGATLQSGKSVVSAITDYGMISYLFKLALFFACCFNGLFSLEILIFVLLFSFDVGNVAYTWAALMVFSTIKYFEINR